MQTILLIEIVLILPVHARGKYFAWRLFIIDICTPIICCPLVDDCFRAAAVATAKWIARICAHVTAANFKVCIC
jgi:hypothetical protein